MMTRRHRRAPVSTLRSRLSQRVSEKDPWDAVQDYEDGASPEPFFLTAALRRMHRFLLIKIAIAAAVVLAAGLLYRGDFSWGAPVLEGFKFAASWDLDLESLTGEVVPAFRTIWQERETGAGPPPVGGSVKLPLAQGKLAGAYGVRPGLDGLREEMHYGIDLTAPAGTRVRAVLGGSVADVIETPGGTVVILNHGGGWQTLYKGLTSTELVKGNLVEAGSLLGVLGLPTSYELPHLHLELRFQDRPVAPPAAWTEQYAEPAL